MSPLDNYAQTLNLLVANDDAPDMFIVNADTMRTYAAQDMLLDLTPYKETVSSASSISSATAW